MARIYPNQLEPGSIECRTCLGVGRIRDGETNDLRKCLDCNGTGQGASTATVLGKEQP